jgi:tRNA (guanine26-N2/guanine27-N2)-dimethyltransferase
MIKQEEGKVIFYAPNEKISKKMTAFYNPVMKLNRDINILILKALQRKHLRIADPLAGTGIRTLRFLKELPPSMIEEIHINDVKENFPKIFEKNRKLNNIKKTKIKVHNTEANKFLLQESGYDYIDIDPFGSPNPFLNNAIAKLSRKGILAVTATDISALAGVHQEACQRKYWATPQRKNKEIGLRILIRKVQLIGAQYDRALTPIFSHASDHYMRIYFSNEKGKQKVDKILAQHNMFQKAGPLWLGNLWDTKLLKKIKANIPLLHIIKEEANIKTIGSIDIHKLCKSLKKQVPKTELLLKEIKKKKHAVSLTHTNPYALKTTMPLKELQKIILKLSSHE